MEMSEWAKREVEINEFYYYPKSGETVKLTKEEYERMKAERINS